METTQLHFNRISGAIIVICAAGMAAMAIMQKKDLEGYIYSFILFMFGILLITRKQSSEAKSPKIPTKKRKAILAALSISLIAGIVIFINAFFF
jgi:hypothetical protein